MLGEPAEELSVEHKISSPRHILCWIIAVLGLKVPLHREDDERISFRAIALSPRLRGVDTAIAARANAAKNAGR